ncbi:MAG: Fe-S cluster assembly ATPase SufC [Candidatus Marsarchaeota archaeon]|jgi:Fe-S cluster assembly ATP-binding protein|nr:Fe-S cluster assembly ATPase SufC [Candidatus Marsarchaeota archaeon]
MVLEIKNLRVSAGDTDIIKGINLHVGDGEFHVIMGPNGSGKTTLAKVIMGHPKYRITGGDILVDGKSIVALSTDKRAKLGLFMLFQNPIEIEGVNFINFLRTAKGALTDSSVGVKQLMDGIKENIKKLRMSEEIINRALNQGFSGGEKKKSEVLQLSVLKDAIRLAILDEPDSGLDVDALRIVAENIGSIAEERKMSVLLITHYKRILDNMKPRFVHVMADGRIVAEGGPELINRVERDGYESFTAR